MSLQDLENLKTEINFQMVSKLKRTKNPTKVFKVLINDNLKRHLIDKYRLNGRFRLANEFIQDFDILDKRNMALNSFCKIENGSFLLKINNNRRANYFEVENDIMVIFLIKKAFFILIYLKTFFKRLKRHTLKDQVYQ
jgi:hypothetical protein